MTRKTLSLSAAPTAYCEEIDDRITLDEAFLGQVGTFEEERAGTHVKLTAIEGQALKLPNDRQLSSIFINIPFEMVETIFEKAGFTVCDPALMSDFAAAGADEEKRSEIGSFDIVPEDDHDGTETYLII